MDIRFMGTGAADFSPLLETEYRQVLSKDARRSSSLLVNGHILIDCGPHTPDSFAIQGIDPATVTDLLITHFHSDHFNRDSIEKIAGCRKTPLRMWYRSDKALDPLENVEFHPVAPLESFETDRFRAVALAANHRGNPLHYDLEVDGVRLFYGCDGAWLLNETFYAMMKRKYHCMVLDATVGDYNGDYRLGEHNSVPMIRLMTASFRTQEVIAPEGIICLSHLARTLHKPHDEVAQSLAPEGYTVAYDGLAIQLKGEG